MRTLTANSLVDNLSTTNNRQIISTFGKIVKAFLSDADSFDYEKNQSESVKRMILEDYYGLFNIWVNKLNLGVDIEKDEFLSKITQFTFNYNKVMETKNPFIYVIEYIDLEADDVMTKSLTKCVFVGTECGFANKSQAIAAFRSNKKAGVFEPTKFGRHKIKYFKKPEVMRYNDLGFEFINELVEFKI